MTAAIDLVHDTWPFAQKVLPSRTLAQTSVIQTRVNDWAYTQFNPSTCTDCKTDKQPAELVEWMLENDSQGVRGRAAADVLLVVSDWVGAFVNQQAGWVDIVQALIPSP